MRFTLDCYDLIRSCENCASGDLVSEGEEVFIYTHSDRFTDDDYPGYVRATVLVAFRDCDCYNYVFELNEDDLPEGINNLARCDVASVGCEPCGNDLNVSGGNAVDDTSGGTSIVLDNIHFFSETLNITVTPTGNVQIELPGSYYIN